MSIKKHLTFPCLIIISVFFFILGFWGLNDVYALKDTITFKEKIQATGLSSENWTADDNGDCFGFVSENKSYESTVSTNNALSGSYSVIFNFGTIVGYNNTPIQMVVALGADTLTKIPLDNTVAYFNTPDDNTLYLAFTGTKIFIFDRANSYQDNDGGSGVNELGTSYWKHLYNFYSGKGLTFSSANVKIEVVSGETTDTLNIYVANTTDFSTVSDCSVSLHKKGVADGYLQFSQAKSVYNDVVGSYSVNGLKVDGALIRKTDLVVLGNKSLVDFTGATKSTLFDNNIASEIISTFMFSDADLEEGDEAFCLTFDSQRLATENNTHKWGVVLGVDASGDLSTGTEIKFARNGLKDADTPAGICVYHCTATPAALTKFTYTITGYKGGRVEITYKDYSTCPGHTAVYNNVDFNGKVAFKIFDSSELEGGFWEVSNVSVDYSALVDKDLELKVNNQENATLIVGDTVKLSTNMDCVLEIADGEEFAVIEGDMLTALSAGEVVIKATLTEDASLSALFNIQIKNDTNYYFEYKNGFDSVQDLNNVQNSCDFYVINSDYGEIGINNVLYFNNTVGSTAAQVGLITPFTHDYQSGVVFDITFTVELSNGNKNERNKNYTCGFAFGLDEIGANPLGQGSGAILINCVKAEMYNNGAVVAPTYITQNQEGATTTYGKDSFGCYADSTCPLTVRLVAKSDGTLEFYRGIIYHRVGEKDIGTYISDLFATYSGFDFNGYVSMFTNNTALNKYMLDGELKDDTCEIKFDNLIVKGNYRLVENMVPEVKDLGITNTMDLLHTELPIELDYYIYTVPNLNLFHGYTVEVISGNASIDSDNRLITTGAGIVKLKISSETDSSVFKEIELELGELEIAAIELDKKLFDNLTNDSQAFYINAKMKGENTYITEYLTIDYEVLEGPVSIIDGNLYINGTGKAKIRVYSHYLPSVEEIVEFNIADADLQYEQNPKGFNSAVIIGAIIVAVCGLAAATYFIIRKVRKGVK